MKKPFSRRLSYMGSTSPRSRSVVLGFLIAGGVLVLVVVVRIVLPGVFFALAKPLLASGTSLTASTGNMFAGFHNAQKLSAQNTALQDQNLALQHENAVLTARAQDLTKLLGGQTTQRNQILAGVLAGPPLAPYDTLLVAAGTSEGSRADAVVFAEGGIPIGTVQTVTTHASQVRLLSSAGRTNSGWVGETRTPVSIVGVGGGAFTASLPKTAAVAVGDVVYVPGPGALPIGTVVRVDSAESSPSVVLRIQPLINLFSLTWVEIVPPTS